MAVVADPLWINASAGAPAYSANELRQAMALALQYNGRTLGARAGVRPGGNSLQTSIAGSTITVRAGVACVDPGLTTAQGPYWVCLQADDTFTLTAAHATLPRKDITILRVYDHDEDSSGLRKAQVEYLVGTAAGSPSEQAVPAGAFKLATIDVPSVASGNPPVVTINNPFTVAAGGLLPVRDATERGLITAFDGFPIYRMDRDWVEVYDGAAWRVQGLAVCSSTADRDSAITSPYNGLRAVTTDLGIVWQRQGGAWCPSANYSVSDTQNAVGTTGSTTYTPTLGGAGVACGFAFIAPPSGKVEILNTLQLQASTGNSFASVQVRTGGTVGSGSDVLAVSDDHAVIINAAAVVGRMCASVVVPGLTPGSTYNVQQLFQNDVAGTLTCSRKHLSMKPA